MRKDYHIEEGEEVRSVATIIDWLEFTKCLLVVFIV